MTPEEIYQQMIEVDKIDKKDTERLLRRSEDYLSEHNFQWNRNKLIETNLALKFLLMRCLALQLALANRPIENRCGE